MKPWIIERIERERQQREWRRLPLHIQEPPPEWIEEQERRRQQEQDEQTPQRGVVVIDL